MTEEQIALALDTCIVMGESTFPCLADRAVRLQDLLARDEARRTAEGPRLTEDEEREMIALYRLFSSLATAGEALKTLGLL